MLLPKGVMQLGAESTIVYPERIYTELRRSSRSEICFTIHEI